MPFSVVSNPEFLKRGAAIDDFMKPDRGDRADEEHAGTVMRALYAPFTRTGAPIMVMDTPERRAVRYAANAMLATRIFVHERNRERVRAGGADAESVRKAVGSDRRIGPSFLFPVSVTAAAASRKGRAGHATVGRR